MGYAIQGQGQFENSYALGASRQLGRDTAAQDVRAVKLPQGGNQRLVLDALRPMFKDGVTDKPGAPPLRPCIELEAAVIAGAASLTCPSDKRTSRTREAITGLVSRGVLGLNDGILWTV